MLLALLLPSSAVASASASPGVPLITEVVEHNPHGVPVTKIHMVLSSHFDAGCKTPGCGTLVPGEPDKCAKVGAGNAHGATDPFGTGEPWAYHIVNRYMDGVCCLHRSMCIKTLLSEHLSIPAACT